MNLEKERRETILLLRVLERDEIIQFSLEWENDTGYDSIPTIETHYVNGCVVPGCNFQRKDPVEMWFHVHLSKSHDPQYPLDKVVIGNLFYRAMKIHGLDVNEEENDNA